MVEDQTEQVVEMQLVVHEEYVQVVFAKSPTKRKSSPTTSRPKKSQRAVGCFKDVEEVKDTQDVVFDPTM